MVVYDRNQKSKNISWEDSVRDDKFMYASLWVFVYTRNEKALRIILVLRNIFVIFNWAWDSCKPSQCHGGWKGGMPLMNLFWLVGRLSLFPTLPVMPAGYVPEPEARRGVDMYLIPNTKYQ